VSELKDDEVATEVAAGDALTDDTEGPVGAGRDGMGIFPMDCILPR